jgi:hypothetical protein
MKRELPGLLREDPGLRAYLLELTRQECKYSAYPSQEKSTRKRLAEAPIQGIDP